jgi:hypothetical protein
MNDFIAIGAVVAGVVIAVGCFVVFHLYSGVHDSLTNAKIGGVYNFNYEQPLQGDPERYMAKVVSVHRLSEQTIRRLNATSRYRRNDGNFLRTTHLVTAQTPDGKIRNFYAERTTNVRRPLLGGVAFKTGLASLLF